MSRINRREILKMGAVTGLTTLVGPGCSTLASLIGSNSTEHNPVVIPPITTRMFWTWDHSTEWALNLPGAHTLGSCNEYGRTKEAFLQDYKTLLTWCGSHNINAVVVWGLLRDTHGGLDAAKAICDVAAQQGVRLLSGVGLNTYGGVYYEGNSPYNLENHLQANPELYAKDANGKPINYATDGNWDTFPLPNTRVPGPRGFYMACPSRTENQEFAAESLAWLFKNLPLGGAQIETGDTGVCQCELCRARRQYPVSTFSWEDMALMYPMATKAIRSVAPEAWVVCETYSHPQPYDEGPNKAPGFGFGKPPWADAALAQFPSGVFVQWVGDLYMRSTNPPNPPFAWTAAGRVPRRDLQHVMRAHYGTNWLWPGFRGEVAVDSVSNLVKQSVAAGIEGISLFGEVAPFATGAELNYLALTDFGSAGNPTADTHLFEQGVVSPLLGGENQASDFASFASLLDRRYPDRLGQIPAALVSIYGRLASLPPGAAQRWCWLANELASYLPS